MFVILLCASVGACKGEQVQAGEQAQTAPAEASVPADEAGFLAELAPLPDDLDALELRYRITGSALAGEMTITLGPGGQRHERWQLQAGAAADGLRTAGLRIVTPDAIWTANEGAPGKLETNHLGALARAYLELAPEARAKVIESIRAWHAQLAKQREVDRGLRGEVLGVSCLQTRIAAQNVCMWEEAGVLLRYEGSAFTIEATQIERAPKLGAQPFALPAAATRAEPEAGTPPNSVPDYAQVLDDIAAGSYGSVSALVLGAELLPALDLPAKHL